MTREPLPLRRWLALGGLVLLAGLSYGLLRWVENSMREAVPPESQDPILIIDRFRAVRMNAAGLREYVVEAPRLTQLPGPLGTRIERPVLDWYQPDGETREWRLQAERGWVAADQKTIRLEGAVVMTRAADSGKTPVEVTTRDLLVRPGERYAETAAPARAVTPGGELRAVGVRAYLDREQLELLSEVRGHYEPSPR
ncbi:MAG: LPS export ABC transporter periplasmic protein LptC [Candidatus Competibacteraceae bacterium]|nr:LPS export ABC transporter periplasmic protein LptC [Candidatus Competibacteraceae bacterium]